MLISEEICTIIIITVGNIRYIFAETMINVIFIYFFDKKT